jgi:hypothetical protein
MIKQKSKIFGIFMKNTSKSHSNIISMGLLGMSPVFPEKRFFYGFFILKSIPTQ